jgi:hypothetical protein
MCVRINYPIEAEENKDVFIIILTQFKSFFIKAGSDIQ